MLSFFTRRAGKRTIKSKTMRRKRYAKFRSTTPNKVIRRQYRKTPFVQHPQTISNKVPVVYGKLYASWCGACQALEPAWKQVSETLTDIPEYSIEDAEMTEAKRADFKSKFNSDIQPADHFPIIYKLDVKGGQLRSYEGERTPEKIVEWVRSG